jgi:hypothetical protein
VEHRAICRRTHILVVCVLLVSFPLLGRLLGNAQGVEHLVGQNNVPAQGQNACQ